MMRHCPPGVCLVLAAALLALPAQALDLGVRGETWAIAEPDLLSEIEDRLEALEASGALARFEREARDRARSRIEAPERVEGVVPAHEERTRRLDPSIVVERDIRTADGTLLAAAGTRVDPFAHGTLTRDLLFIDGTRPAKVAWALDRIRTGGRPATIVLLAGRPLALARRHGRPFFFDQDGRLARRLALRATPTLVTRDGAQLRIAEIPIRDRAEDGR